VFGNVGVLVSLILIEMGLYITEQRVFGFQNGAFFIYSLFSYMGLITFFTFSKITETGNFNFLSKPKKLFLPIYILFALIIFLAFLKNPDFNRFNIFDGPFKMTLVRIENIFFFLFLYSLFRKKHINEKIVIYVFYCIIMFARGSQFGAFLIAGLWFFMSLKIDEIKIRPKYYILLIVFSALPFAIKIYSNDISYSLMRMVLQGHVFWGTVNIFNESGANPDFSGFISNFNDLFSSFQMGNINYGFGKLMKEVSPQFGEMYMEGGVRFSAGYPAILIYHFGYLSGLFLHLFFTITYFYLINFMIKCFKYKDVFFSYFYYLIFIVYSDLLIMGEYAHFRLKFLIKLGILFLIHLLYKNYSNKKNTSFVAPN